MKKFIVFVMLLMVSVSAFGADATLSYTISGEKVAEYISDYVYVHKNTETIPDPKWVDPKDGTSAPRVAKYTDAQWVREHIYRYIKGQIIRGKKAKYRDAVETYNANDIS